MNREIKFRAYVPHRDYMFNMRAIDLQDEKLVVGVWNNEETHVVDVFDDAIFMQYTGLKDKNGVEIYEGDIVKASLLGDGKYHGDRDEVQFKGNGVIDIDPLHLMVNFKDGNRDNFYIYEAILHRETEVIGNIYENPELLKDATNA